MKFHIALGLIATTASATTTTTNECWEDEGAEYVGKCFDLWYILGHCDEYLLEA